MLMKIVLRPLLFLVLLLTFTANARALEVLSARWGRGGRWADVRAAVEAQLARGRRSFEASNDNLGVDPAKGDSKVLEVVYADRSGRTYRERVKEGDTFRFAVDEQFSRGPAIVEERGPRIGLRFEGEERREPVPGGSVRIVNRYPHTIRLFTVSRSGEQRFVATLGPGDRITPEVPPRPGRRWIVTTVDGAELRSFTSGLDGEVIVLR